LFLKEKAGSWRRREG